MKYRKLTIKASEIVKAIIRAQKTSDEWQAQCLEVILIPKIYRRWREVNVKEYRKSDPTLTRWPGLPYHGHNDPEQNRALRERSEIHKYAGYVLTDGDWWRWNSVGSEYFSHSASTAWDGVRREFGHQFVEGLRQIVAIYLHNGSWDIRHWERDFEQRGILLVNDLDRGAE